MNESVAHNTLRVLLTMTMTGAFGASAQSEQSRSETSSHITFSKHIAPIVFDNCFTCHNPNGPAPFNLLTYDDVASRASLIGRVTEQRYMPPWLPDSGYGHFSGERHLTESQIKTIAKWIEQGTLEGDIEDLPQAPNFSGEWQLGEPDLILTVPRFELAPHDDDVYRNLVIAIPIDARAYVQSIELRPGGTNVVHHARMMTDETNSSRLLDEGDAGPGFDGMDLMSNAQNPDGFFVGWTPGKVAFQNPDDMSWPVQPGTDLVLQVHLPPSTDRQVVEPEIGVYLAKSPPSRRPALIMLGSFDIDIPAGEAEYTVSDSYELPVDVSALAVYPHAHYLGKRIEGFAELPSGEIRWLVRISDWDFNWQDEYHFAEPVDIPAGAILTMRITYDNSAANPRNPNSPPRRVVYGSNSTDEMADLVVQVLPKDPADLAYLRRDIDIWQYKAVVTHMARVEHEDGLANAAEGRLEDAIVSFREAISYINDDPRTHNDLGSALAMTGSADQAVAHFREASRLDPDWAEPAMNLAIIQLAIGTPEGIQEAVTSARRAAGLTDSTEPTVLDVLSRALAASGETSEAIRIAESALELAISQSRDGLADQIRIRLDEWRKAESGRAVGR